MTPSQQEAFEWLQKRGGDGMFDKNGVAVACGESAPHMRATWNALQKLGVVEFYNPSGKGRGRLRIVPLTMQQKCLLIELARGASIHYGQDGESGWIGNREIPDADILALRNRGYLEWKTDDIRFTWDEISAKGREYLSTSRPYPLCE